MRTRGTPTTRGAHRPATRFGGWRAAAAAPDMLGSLLLLSVTIGGLDPWAGPILLIWVGCAAVTLTRVGERLAVRAALGFRRPSPAQAAVLHPLWAAALRLADTPAGVVDLAVQRARHPMRTPPAGTVSPSPAGCWRTTGPADCRMRRWWPSWCTNWAIRPRARHNPMLVAMWLAAPCRAAARLLTGLGSPLSGRRSRRGLGVAGASGFVVAVARATHQGHWLAGGVVAAVALCAVICPLADAWVCRRAEFAADRFAAERGVAVELSSALSALSALNDGSSAVPGWSRRLVASHPSLDRRISTLLALPTGSHVPSQARCSRSAGSLAAGECGLDDHHFDHHLSLFGVIRRRPPSSE
jgi:STE24 endopeptidase